MNGPSATAPSRGVDERLHAAQLRNPSDESTAARPLPCQTQQPELWFSDDRADVARAKALCRDCVARLECLAGALLRQEEVGVWGGEVFWHGVIVPDRPRRGRPRKDESRRPAALRSA